MSILSFAKRYVWSHQRSRVQTEWFQIVHYVQSDYLEAVHV
jgi:hypothetical protein